jgi:hypothetical protein
MAPHSPSTKKEKITSEMTIEMTSDPRQLEKEDWEPEQARL